MPMSWSTRLTRSDGSQHEEQAVTAPAHTGTPDLEFSIVLCTRNRATLLTAALASIAVLEYAPGAFELLVIDNDSSDATCAVAQEFAARVPFEVRVIREARVGLSAARNRGIREARGRYLFFTDDDQLVDPHVLQEYGRIVSRYSVSIVQGAIELRFTGQRPSWLHGHLARMLGETEPLAEGQALEDLYGGNLLLRRDLFDTSSGFDEALGKGRAGYSEDTELARRLRAAGEKIVYAPAARIYHVIGPDRARATFFFGSAFQKGRSHARLEAPPQLLWTYLRLSALRSVVHTLRAARYALHGDSHAAIAEQVESAFDAGKIATYLSQITARLLRVRARRTP
jgi:GT2 family glycosyltransferase